MGRDEGEERRRGEGLVGAKPSDEWEEFRDKKEGKETRNKLALVAVVAAIANSLVRAKPWEKWVWFS